MLTGRMYRIILGLFALVAFGSLVFLMEYRRAGHLRFPDSFSHSSIQLVSRFQSAVVKRNKTNLTKLRFNKVEGMENIQCDGVMNGDENSIKFAEAELKKIYSEDFEDRRKKLIFTDETVAGWADSCEVFITSRQYIMSLLSKEEEEYPIAYSISIYNNLQSFEHLLRAIYRPQNIYCIHVDQKSLAEFQTRVMKIIRCFDNVFLASRMTRVWYTHWTIVQASLNCMEELVKRKSEYPWKYVINVCGQDYPTKTNLEFVRTLKNLHGNNSVPSRTLDVKEGKYKRTKYVFKHAMDLREDHQGMVRTDVTKKPVPHNFQVFTGSDYFIFSREAVEFILTDPDVQDFFEWAKDTHIPDETVWATLIRIYPRLPGSRPPDKKYDTYTGAEFPRTRKWESGGKTSCGGKFVRLSCVYGLSDLKWIISQKHLLANKFHPDVDIFAMNCLAEWLRNRTINML